MSTRTPSPPTGLDAAKLRVGIVAARFNGAITEHLLAGAHEALRRHGITDAAVREFWVPGAFEIPVVLERLARSASFDALVAIGCVVRGETPHFELVAQTCANGCAEVARTNGIPVGFGVIATDTWAQAEARAGGEHGNKGAEATLAALETAAVLRSL
ncbi:MAG: 6,7-dimethyl-8-ribityllumazine synthase [Nitriliruptoraceae bacterium]